MPFAAPTSPLPHRSKHHFFRIKHWESFVNASIGALKARDAGRCAPELLDLVVGNLTLVCASTLADLALLPGHNPLGWARTLVRLVSSPRFANRPSLLVASKIVLAYAMLPRKARATPHRAHLRTPRCWSQSRGRPSPVVLVAVPVAYVFSNFKKLIRTFGFFLANFERLVLGCIEAEV